MTFKATALALLLLPASLAEAQEPATWDWTVAPYLWASSVGLDLTVADNATIGGDAAFKDLMDKVDTAFMGHLEARKGAWGIYLDTIYLDLSESKSVAVGPGGPILGDLDADARMKMKIFDAGGAYRLSKPGADVQVDLLAGLRYIAADVDGPIGNGPYGWGSGNRSFRTALALGPARRFLCGWLGGHVQWPRLLRLHFW